MGKQLDVAHQLGTRLSLKKLKPQTILPGIDSTRGRVETNNISSLKDNQGDNQYISQDINRITKGF